MLANGREVSGLPALLVSLDQGDDSLLSRQIESRYNGFDGGISLMGRLIECAGAKPDSRPVASEPGATFGDVVNLQLWRAACQGAATGFTLGPEYFAPLFSTVPTLFLTGSLDANTPPANAERMRWGFANATHLVIENGVHETLPSPEVQAVVADFLRGRDVAGRHLRLPAPQFLSLAEAKQRAGGPPH
jgi:pimeloyl-ACP methyl ester carboxylesterase